MDSRFTHHFGTNYVPTDEEIEEIGADLLCRTEELTRIDGRIRELSEQRDKLLAYIEPRQALISHPRRLPSDILEAIFLACLPTGRNAVMSAQEAPLLLCRICSAWRTAALSMPRLWASLHIPIAFISAKSDTRRPAVEQWLTRAAASAMRLSLCNMSASWGTVPLPSDDEVAALVKSVAKFSPRWQNVEFTWMDDVTAQALAGIHAPGLESFKFAGNLIDLSHFDQVLNSPRLRAVSLSSSKLALVPTLPIAWHQLTTLVIHCAREGSSSISLADIISLFGRCPQLVSFQVALRVNDPPFDYRSSSLVTLSFLEEFTVVPSYLYFHNWYLACIMDCVSMPKLRRFHLPILENVGSESDNFSLASLGERYPLLEDLAIHLASLNSQALLNVLHSFPALTRLVVNACPLLRGDGDAWNSNWDSSRNSSGTARLLETLLDTTVCPHLQELEIMEAKTLNKNILVTFLSARVQVESASQLRSLSISFQTAWDESEHSTIPHLSPAESEYYCSLGLTISFFPHAPPKHPDAPSPWTGLPL
ncbi:hypothetical protein R3P38DRAFT_3068799 [Favolaschia claudopus]|uniref:F-box domain-containing protein n=1 Tax=Favolaschia claudopus TaxID=2862362 RepID=A0AAW0A0E3_9AGAR